MRQVELALYYQAQIDLFAEMVLDRSCNTILVLSEMLPYQLLVSCMANENIPAQVRASYTRLLCRLWIDRFPHERIRVPKRLQLLEEVRDRQLLDDDGKPIRKSTHDGQTLQMATLPHFQLQSEDDAYMNKLVGLSTAWASDIDGIAVEVDEAAQPSASRRRRNTQAVRSIINTLVPDWNDLTEVVGGGNYQWADDSEEEEQEQQRTGRGTSTPPASPLLGMVQETKAAAQKLIDDALKASEEATSAYNEIRINPSSPTDHMSDDGASEDGDAGGEHADEGNDGDPFAGELDGSSPDKVRGMPRVCHDDAMSLRFASSSSASLTY